MSLDGRLHSVPKQVEGPARLNWRTGDCGSEYVARPNGFGRCKLGHMHCGNCGGVGRRFRKSYVCGNC